MGFQCPSEERQDGEPPFLLVPSQRRGEKQRREGKGTEGAFGDTFPLGVYRNARLLPKGGLAALTGGVDPVSAWSGGARGLEQQGEEGTRNFLAPARSSPSGLSPP